MAQLEKEKWLIGSVFLNLVLAIGKLLVGFITNAGVIIADGIHSISDVFGSILIYISIKLAGKRSDLFPYGMHKLEDFASLIGGIAIIYAGYEILKGVVFENRVFHIKHVWVGILFLFAVLVVQSLFAYFEMRSSKKLNSPGVNVDLLNWLSDIGATVVAILGVILSYNNVIYAQKVAVVIIVLLILKESFSIIKDAVLTLLDASVNPSIVKKAEEIINSHPSVDKIKSLFIRRAGSIFIGDIVLQVKAKNIKEAHSIVDDIEKKLKDSIEHLEFVIIHYEPVQKKGTKIAKFLASDGSLAERLKDVAVIELLEIDDKGRIVNRFRYDNPYFEEGRGHSIRLISWLVKQNVDKVMFNPRRIDTDKIQLFESLGISIISEANSS